MRRSHSLIAGISALLVLATTTVWALIYFSDALIWRRLLAELPPVQTSEEVARTTDVGGWWSGTHKNGFYEVGHVVLGNGEVLRYAFVSHHVIGNSIDSYTLFVGSDSCIRVKGPEFCCEVILGGEQPANLDQFVAGLRMGRDIVELQ